MSPTGRPEADRASTVAARPVRIGVAATLRRGAFAEQRLRALFGVAAIALGVALGYAVQLINAAAVDELARSARALAGSADLEVQGPRSGFDEALYPELARRPEVAVASPVVEVEAALPGRGDTLRIVGVDVFEAARLDPSWVAATRERFDPFRADALLLSPAAADSLGVAVGDAIDVQSGLGAVRLTVVALLVTGGGERYAVMDIAAAQAVFGRVGRLTRIDLAAVPGTDVAALREAIARTLPPGVVVVPPDDNRAIGAGLTRSYRVNLNVLALMALFTGGLLVFSTQALSIVRRRAELALLRVLGVTRGRIVAGLLAEGAAVGAVGSAAGLAAGALLAAALLRFVGADLGSGYFRGIVPALRFEWTTAAAFFALGVAAAVAGAWLPAREAVRTPPAQALKSGDAERGFERVAAAWPGIALLAAGGLATLLPPVDGLPLFGYAAIGLLLIGTLLLLPRCARLLLSAVPPLAAPAPGLALAQLRGAPGQATVSLAAIVASVALMVSMAIMVASFRTSVDAWLGELLPADLYFRAASAGDSALLSPADQARIAALQGVRRADFQREDAIAWRPGEPRIALLARTLDPTAPQKSLPFVAGPLAVPAGAPPPVWVSEAVADRPGVALGSVIRVPLAGRDHDFTVAGVWRDYSRPRGTLVIERARYVALTGDQTATNGALWLEPGAALAEVRSRLVHELPGGERLDIGTAADIRRVSLAIFDRTFAVTYALELAAMVIGLAALSSSFAALVLARRREFGMLRHLGMTRGEIRAMLAVEGALVSGVGLAVGLVQGGVISLVLIHVVNRQSFHWSMDLAVPWAPLAGFVAVVFSLSVLTAVLAGRRATAGDAIRAVREDW